MKRKFLSALTVLVLILTALTSCFGGVASEGEALVVIENLNGSFTEYTLALENIKNKDEGVAGLLEALSEQSENPMSLDMQNSTYGKYVNAIGSLTPDGTAGEYISIYTSVESDFDTSAYVKELSYKNKTLKTSGLGISSMKVPSGAVILFRIESYTG